MAYKSFKNSGGTVSVDLGDLNPKQKLFCQARTRYVAYGGARGGGKTHVLRVKAFGGALTYPGIRILIVRREYPELEAWLNDYCEKIKPFICDTGAFLRDAQKQGKKILFEAQLGALRDLDYGIFP